MSPRSTPDNPHYQDPQDWATSLEPNLLHCRELGHSWDAYTASYDNSTHTYDRTLRCSSCTSERRQVLDSSGEVVKNGYAYVPGYLAKGQLDSVGHKVPRAVFRLAALERVVGPTTLRSTGRGTTRTTRSKTSKTSKPRKAS